VEKVLPFMYMHSFVIYPWAININIIMYYWHFISIQKNYNYNLSLISFTLYYLHIVCNIMEVTSLG
jgi:hypothetical protein